MDPTSAPSEPFEYLSEGEHITDSVQIAALLKKVKDSRTLLQVTLPGGTSEYNSAILDVNHAEGYLLLDELTPPEGHQLLSKDGRFTALIRLRGIDMRFSSHVQEVGGQAGIAFYRADLPASLYYRQRRSSYRVKIGLGLTVPFTIGCEDGKSVQGHLDDISLGGIGAILKQQLHLDKGATVPTCSIQLPRNEKIDFEIEVCYISQDEQHRKFHLGARFVNLDRTKQNTLKRFVAETERELLRRKLKE